MSNRIIFSTKASTIKKPNKGREQMKFVKMLPIFIFLLLSSCSTNKTTGIIKHAITVPFAEGKSFPAATYRLQSSDKIPALILAFNENPGESVQDEFASKIASSGYFVIAIQKPQTHSSLLSPDSVCVRELAAVVRAAKSSPYVKTNKIGLWGTGLFGIAALHVAAIDSNIAAIVTMNVAKHFTPSENQFLKKLSPRPILIIESTRKPRHPEKAKIDYFNSAKQPKKLVWLATSIVGAYVLSTDMEPIVRTTTLELIDRYLKGK